MMTENGMVTVEFMEIQLGKVRDDEAKKWLSQEAKILQMEDEVRRLNATADLLARQK